MRFTECTIDCFFTLCGLVECIARESAESLMRTSIRELDLHNPAIIHVLSRLRVWAVIWCLYSLVSLRSAQLSISQHFTETNSSKVFSTNSSLVIPQLNPNPYRSTSASSWVACACWPTPRKSWFVDHAFIHAFFNSYSHFICRPRLLRACELQIPCA